MKQYILFCLIMLAFSSLQITAQPRWQALPNAPMTGGKFDDVFFLNEKLGWLGGPDESVSKTTDGGVTWQQYTIPGVGRIRCIGFADSLYGWVGSLNNNACPLYQTTNGGVTWSIADISVYPPGICAIYIVNDTVVYAAGRYSDSAGLLKSTNKGQTWSYRGLTSQSRGITDVKFFNADTGFVAGMDVTGKYAVVLKTYDGGETWSVKKTSTHQNEWAWKIHFTDDTLGYISIQRFSGAAYYLKTTDRGETWQEKVIFPSQNYNVQGIAFVSELHGWMGPYASTSSRRMIETTDGGATWVFKEDTKSVNRFRMFNDTLGFAVGGTVYKYTSEILTKVKDPAMYVPAGFKVIQNFPNPFNPLTTIHLYIHEAGMTKISVYSSSGEEVAVLENTMLEPGFYEYLFSGHTLASGVYMCKINSGSQYASMKMLLLK